ncbi:MAG: radical SAM protein [Thermoplasmata archaeon]|nr:radical SAM protein [Thermoplasmata archaeon]MCI4359946.1 radical SAM protein [Thermoplasmata archaeon]
MAGLRLQMLPMASAHRGPMSPACTQCAEGKKMVLFVTGLCRFRCFYCPVSERRNQVDVAYANERPIRSDSDVLDEARAMGAEGTGITGGDPLGVIDRTVHYVELLKREFGPSHHIHLYTHEPNAEKLQRLAHAGLDEFRLHIPHYLWGPLASRGGAYRTVLEQAPEWGIRRGVEIPVLPEKSAELRGLLRTLGEIGVDFVNLNELEFSETNERKLYDRRYDLDPRGGWGVRGSREVAEKLVRESRGTVPVHYCSSRFKDGVQLKQRLLRRLERTAPPFAVSTGEGTLLLGVVEPQVGSDLEETGRLVARLAGIGESDYRVDAARRRVELAPRVLRRVARRLAAPAFVVEEYPTADALEVERTPLNASARPVVPAGG